MDLLQALRGKDDAAPSSVTPPDVRDAALRRLKEQQAILAGIDAEIDARQPRRAEPRRGPR